MNRFENVFVLGTSCSGKTTLVNSLRTPEFEDSVFIPRRLITRAPRLNNDEVENRYVSFAEFKEMASAGLVLPFWDRIFERGRVERYGFEVQPKDDDRLPVYSANNALLRDPGEQTNAILSRGLGVMATAIYDIKWARLDARSPDLSIDERLVRVGEREIDPDSCPYPLVVVDTSTFRPSDSETVMQHIVRDVLSGELSPDV